MMMAENNNHITGTMPYLHVIGFVQGGGMGSPDGTGFAGGNGGAGDGGAAGNFGGFGGGGGGGGTTEDPTAPAFGGPGGEAP